MLWIVAALAGLFLAACLLLFLFQDKLVFMPVAELAASPAAAGLACEDLRLALGPDAAATVHGWLVPGRADGSLAGWTALFCHGNGGNISHRLETLALLHGLGLQVLIFDYPGYGQSSGKPSEPGCHAAARAAWRFLVDNGVAPERIVAWGRSLGGAVAARLAAEVRPGALIIESCFTSIPAMGAKQYPVFPRPLLRLLSRSRFDAETEVTRVTCPVLVAHSPDDELVPYAMGRRLHEAAPGPKAFLALTGGHNEGWQLLGKAYPDGITNFLAAAHPAAGRDETGSPYINR